MSYLKVAGINHPSATTGGLAISSGGIVTGGGLDYITSSTFSAAASVSVDGCFTSTYDNYRIVAQGVSSISSSFWNVRGRTSGVDNTSSSYSWNIGYVQSTTVASLGRGAGTNYLALGWMSDSSGTLMVDVISPLLAKWTAFQGVSAMQSGVTAFTGMWTGGMFAANTAFDGISIYPDSGTFTGTVTVYGYRKA